MNERECKRPEGADGTHSSTTREGRLRALIEVANPYAHPCAEPPAVLRRRVAELASQSGSGAAWYWGQWRWLIYSYPACAAVALVLATLILTLPPRAKKESRHAAATRSSPFLSSVPDQAASILKPALPPPIDSSRDRFALRGNGQVTSFALHGQKKGPGRTPPPATASQHEGTVTGDMADVSRDPEAAVQQLTAPPKDEWEVIEAQVKRQVQAVDDFIQILLPRLATASDRPIAAAIESYKREAAIVDPRLARQVTCASKAKALSDLCDQLRSETGIRLEAGRSVADEKVTVFCKELPLREVMRQLSRPFGYAWLRSGKEGEYRYELVQDLRSQLLEEELRNRDRNAALLALDQEMNRYRSFLSLSPDEALVRAQTASPAEKWLLERYARQGWGPAQMYFRLSPQELAQLRTGQMLRFSQEPKPGELPLPPDLAQGVLQSLRDMRFRVPYDGREPQDAKTLPDGHPPAAIPEARVMVTLALNQRDLGQIKLRGGTRIGIKTGSEVGFAFGRYFDPIGVGVNPSVRDPQNAIANARLARDPALRPRITVHPQASCGAVAVAEAAATRAAEPRVTTADVLEALHQATGLPVVADYYTRLYPVSNVWLDRTPLFDALNQLADTMRFRWSKEGNWLQFRTVSFYDDRLKEVPNRLLTRWSASRKEHGTLTLDDLLEIAQLSEAQLDAASMAEGAKACFGLAEWDLPRNGLLRPHLHYLAGLTPAQRQQAQSAAGLAFNQMSVPQQQRFLTLAFGPDSDELQSLEELAGASLQVDYSVPGGFEWRRPKEPKAPGWHEFRPSPVRERSREAALQAARRIDPQADVEQIAPTGLAFRILYNPGPSTRLRPGGMLATPIGTFDLTISRIRA